MGVVYIAVSDRMYYRDEDGKLHEFVKIGMTKGKETIESRMKSLNGTSTPYPLECLYAVDVGNKAKEAEKQIHKIFDKYRIRKGKYQREFFKIERDRAVEQLKILEIMNGTDVTPDDKDTVVDEDDKRIVRERIKRRKNFTFSEVEIPPGETLYFRSGQHITCEVVDDKKVKFRGKVTSLSNATAIALQEMYNKRRNPNAVAGTRYWIYKGTSLEVLRKIKNSPPSSLEGFFT